MCIKLNIYYDNACLFPHWSFFHHWKLKDKSRNNLSSNYLISCMWIHFLLLGILDRDVQVRHSPPPPHMELLNLSLSLLISTTVVLIWVLPNEEGWIQPYVFQMLFFFPLNWKLIVHFDWQDTEVVEFDNNKIIKQSIRTKNTKVFHCREF